MEFTTHEYVAKVLLLNVPAGLDVHRFLYRLVRPNPNFHGFYSSGFPINIVGQGNQTVYLALLSRVILLDYVDPTSPMNFENEFNIFIRTRAVEMYEPNVYIKMIWIDERDVPENIIPVSDMPPVTVSPIIPNTPRIALGPLRDTYDYSQPLSSIPNNFLNRYIPNEDEDEDDI
jgi:hypothetical protein